ncbi:hypothetical protein Golob_021479 [Gossypium lobatum]|uniref:Uncharacterized protein n=1 Tax=Gossypium lobatum TaxID=34289 RepID=A0A7J8LDM8_9ROSI|nr:hypothetical protein [Gossypium lobatum]
MRQGNVPFSWENKPGVCKETSQQQHYFLQKLPPPPPPPPPSTSIHGTKIPPPPPFALSGSYSRRGFKKSNDPFLAAYMECTKSTSNVKLGEKHGGGSGLKKGLFNFSSKQSCSVRNGSLVRISKLVLMED